MTYAAVSNALRSRFNTQWASATPVVWDNVVTTPPETGSWARFTIGFTAADRLSFGADTAAYRHYGSVIVSIFTELNIGDSAAMAYADTVAAIFRGWADATNKLVCRAPYAQRIGADSRWYQVNVICPFEFDGFF